MTPGLWTFTCQQTWHWSALCSVLLHHIIPSPFSHLEQGLFQASPRVAQQWDFRVAPLMLTSQRPLMIFSQQVLLVVSDYWHRTHKWTWMDAWIQLSNHFKIPFLRNNPDSPIHSRPELSSELPIEHKHRNDPGLFLQSPLMQGLDSHSFTSAGDRNR